MITFMVILSILCFVFGLAYLITRFALKTVFWVAIKLPLAIISFVLGALCCCTIILIPLGLAMFGLGIHMLIPRRKGIIA